MFVPHVVVPHHRRDGRKPPTPQKLAAILTAAMGAGMASAGVGAAFSKHSHHDAVVLACIVVGLAFVVGIVLARVIGGHSRM